ncbi:RTP1/Tango6 family protein [Aspergillus saccharolyticus JOP 1030-1]|uniref:Protein required for cell viability n=1 Tax=Aspergillus saccharolyticus JOP 1030-1 TaxID=1450539 RepID=A0A318ZST8_9EURO|nr:hypothetical protein BP01DRAFT_331057 [Aspergillus saccharolyticus JOP 1030-1]PYH49704.1 hypothetical protein BP01DRAFT_331057 [Aspergillus saccharolyticus JOP 1030-1]
MGESPRVKEAFDAATRFLDPVLQRGMLISSPFQEIQKHRGKSLLDILLRSDVSKACGDETSKRRDVIGVALQNLSSIHIAFVTPLSDAEKEALRHSTADTEDAALEDAKRRRLLHALLDLISLEGIYPSLSGGVAIPLQKRVISVLPAGVIAQQHQVPPHEKPQDETLLEQVIVVLADIVFDSRPSIQPVVRGRILSDMISGLADLGYNSVGLPDDKKTHYQHGLAKLLEETPSSVVLSTLSPFLQADPAQWFKAVVSGFLSRLPLRPDGVLQIMIFLASQLAPSLGVEAQAQTSNGPRFTVQAIMQTSRLLSSVPQGMDPDEYFTTIAPQLLGLMDGEDPDLRKTAAYVVGNGILSKRSYGSRGTIGHSIFLVPIFEALTACLSSSSMQWLTPKDEAKKSSGQVLVDEALLTLAVDRLTSLVLQPPNPGLVKRIVYPVLLPLWGLACYALEQEQTVLHEKVLTILQAYFGLSGGLEPLKKLVDNLLWDGGSAWTYGIESQKSIILVKRNPAEPGRNVVRLVDTLHSRAKLFLSILGADSYSEERTGDIFLYVSERWLVKRPSEPETLNTLKLTVEDEDSSAIIQKLVSAKLAETLLDNFKDTLSRRPLRVLELITQIIDGELYGADARKKKITNTIGGNVSLSSLANIVNTEETGHEADADSDSTESLPAVFSLLSTVLASPDFTTSPETVPALESLKSKLDELIPHLPPSLAKPGTTASMLTEIQLMSSNEQSSDSNPAVKTSSEISDFETHRRALTSLNSDLAPIQAEGFSLLSTLIKKSSPVLDIPSTLTLLLSILTDPSDEPLTNDEFVYLNAINLIGTLASRHPRTVLKTLVDRYIDRAEVSGNQIDQRLKIGEALLRTAQDLGEALTGEPARLLGEGMITVASRRAHKPEAQKARRERLAAEQRKREREARKQEREAQEIVMPSGWSLGPASSSNNTSSTSPNPLIEDNDDDDDDEENHTPEQLAQYANILDAWAAGSKHDAEPDDLRVRASALSILATAIQTNILGLGPSIIGPAVDLALATLTMEPEAESAILRRASAVLLLDILKAMDTVREEKGTEALGFGFSLAENQESISQAGGPSTTVVGNIPRMLRTLSFVESWETDSIVRGHVRAVVESLEAWLEKALMWGIGAATRSAGATVDQDGEPRMELGDRIAGLSIDPLSGTREASLRPRIEEIE